MRTPPSTHKLRVALGFPSGIAVGERIQQGIISYAREKGGWSFTQHPEMIGTSAEWLQSWHGDGAFIFATAEQEIALAMRLKFPVVNLLVAQPGNPPIPTVCSDHYATGQIAAEHFISKKFRRLGFYGPAGLFFSEERLRGFEECAGERVSISKLLVSVNSTDEKRRKRNLQENMLEKWLGSLEYPVGVFAATDRRGNMVLEACRRMGLKVPRDVAVLGVDNDPFVYEVSEPSLSTVARNDFEAGRQAAILLESLIHGKRPARKLITIPPEGILERESTRTLAVDDCLIAVAIERIQNRINQPFGAEEIAAELPISRHHFEARFQKAIGQSPYAFINHLRVERAKAMLEVPEPISLTEIAAACGFTSPARFRLVFLRTTGKLPSEWKAGIKGIL